MRTNAIDSKKKTNALGHDLFSFFFCSLGLVGIAFSFRSHKGLALASYLRFSMTPDLQENQIYALVLFPFLFASLSTVYL